MARVFLAWLAILPLAIANGAFREAVLVPHLGKSLAFAASGLLLALGIVLVAVVLARWLALGVRVRWTHVGATWLALTLVFEFGFGALRGQSWSQMLAPYTFSDGNLWPLVLAATFFAPLIAERLRGRPP